MRVSINMRFRVIWGVVGLMLCSGMIEAQTWTPVNGNLSLEGQNAGLPQVVMSSDGSKTITVWERSDGANTIIQESHSTDGGQSWSAAVNLSLEGQSAELSQVAMSSNDGSQIVAVWQRSDGANTIIQESHSTDGGQNWSTASNLSLEGQNARLPQVVMSSDGSKTITVWERSDGANTIIQESHSTDSGQSWSAVVNLSLEGQSAELSQVAMSSNDGSQIAAIWQRSDGANTIIQESHSTDGGQNWSTASNLSLEGQNARLPQVVMSSDGSKTITVWERSDGVNTIIQESHSTDSGQSWSAVVNLSLEGQSAELSQVAMSSSDGSQIVVVWQRSDGANTIIQESHSTDGGQNWSVAASLSLEGRSALDPQVAISSDGSKAVAVWQRSDGSNIIIQESHSTDGGQNWSAASNLSQGGRNAFDGQVAMNSDGSNIVAVWGRSDGVNYIVQESHSTDGGQNWSAGANLSLEGQDGGFPQVAMSSDGSKIVAVWARSEGASWIIQESHSTDGGQNWSAAANLSLSSAESTTSDIWGRSGRENWILQESHSTDGGQNWSAAAYVSLSSDGSNSVAVWRRFDGANWIIQESHSTDGGQNWSIASNLSLEGRNARLPQVVMSSDGSKTITVWERSDGANTIIQESHSTDGGQSWSAAVNLSLEGQSAELSQVAMSSNDGSQIVAVWQRFDGANTIIQESHSTDGGQSWSTASNLSLEGQNARLPQVVMSSDGSKAVAVWLRFDGVNFIIQETHSTDSGQSWSAAVNLSLEGRDAMFPQIAISSDGSQNVVVRQQSNGANWIIQESHLIVGGQN